jgi:NAD(P)-dependent dehydrogenase (short-subunit alcohol dehydrogenase family)
VTGEVPLMTGLKPGLRVAISAGAGGIGRSLADAFIAHGSRVAVCDVDEAALRDFERAHPDHVACKADVGSQREVDGFFDTLESAFSGLDVLVNNAGIAGPTAAVEEIDPDEWRRTVDINLSGQFYCARRAVPLLKRNAGGVMINVSSVAGRLAYPYRLPYAATKWAIVGMTQSLALELGSSGIRVNALLPGLVEGPRIDRVIQARADELGIDFGQMRERYLEKVALGRMVTHDDLAAMALFLCSSLGRNISGQSLSVCGDIVAL